MNDNGTGIKFDKTITLNDIMKIIAAAGIAFVWFFQMDARTEILEKEIQTHVKNPHYHEGLVARVENQYVRQDVYDTDMDHIKRVLDKIEKKLP